MKKLEVGMCYSYTYQVPLNKTVPYQFPEVEELQVMPEVFTSGFMIGMFEFVCVKALKPFLNWPSQQSVGVGFNLTHISPTPPDFTIKVDIELVEMKKNRLRFKIIAHDGVDVISEGVHDRHIINCANFNKKILKKLSMMKCLEK